MILRPIKGWRSTHSPHWWLCFLMIASLKSKPSKQEIWFHQSFSIQFRWEWDVYDLAGEKHISAVYLSSWPAGIYDINSTVIFLFFEQKDSENCHLFFREIWLIKREDVPICCVVQVNCWKWGLLPNPIISSDHPWRRWIRQLIHAPYSCHFQS